MVWQRPGLIGNLGWVRSIRRPCRCVLSIDEKSQIQALASGDLIMTQSGIRINAGFFVFKRDIFKYIRPWEELVIEPFHRLIEHRQLAALSIRRLLCCDGTIKDKQRSPPSISLKARTSGAACSATGPGIHPLSQYRRARGAGQQSSPRDSQQPRHPQPSKGDSLAAAALDYVSSAGRRSRGSSTTAASA
jgi:hypothetical protein